MTRRSVGVLLFAFVAGVGILAAPAVCGADEGDTRPGVTALRLSEADVLARFTPEVGAKMALRGRALTLWRTQFAAEAAKIERRYLTETDWRPALAEASALVETYLDVSLLPRTREWPAGDRKVWIESLDPKTGQRVRTLQPARTRPVLYAPDGIDGTKNGDDADSTTRPPVRPGAVLKLPQLPAK